MTEYGVIDITGSERKVTPRTREVIAAAARANNDERATLTDAEREEMDVQILGVLGQSEDEATDVATSQFPIWTKMRAMIRERDWHAPA